MPTHELLARLRATGSSGPLFDALERISSGMTQPAGPVRLEQGRTRVGTETGAKEGDESSHLASGGDFLKPGPGGQVVPPALTHSVSPLPQARIQINPLQTMTACMDAADCPATARRLYRILFEIGLETVRARGLAVMPNVAVYHLPSEYLAAHLGVCRETVWKNLKHLKRIGVLDERDHYGTLRGQTCVTGKVWAVSLRPEAQISKRADPVRVKADDLKFPWRDLDADAQAGRTVYNLTRTEEQKALDVARAAERGPQQAEARARATARKSARLRDTRAGKKPLCGRKAATVNAAETRAVRAAAPPRETTQQSNKKGLKAVNKGELKRWALTPFSPKDSDDTLTVAAGPAGGLDTIFSLPSLVGLSRRERGAAVEKTARSLAAMFEDSDNTRFWCWLLWQMLRGADQGQDWSDDISIVLARVFQDLKHEETMNSRTARKPGAVVAAELRAAGLLDALRTLSPTRVGMAPKNRAA